MATWTKANDGMLEEWEKFKVAVRRHEFTILSIGHANPVPQSAKTVTLG